MTDIGAQRSRSLAVLLLSGLLGVAVYAIAIRTGRGQDIDEMARESRKLTELAPRRAGVLLLRGAVVTVLPLLSLASVLQLVRQRRWRSAVLCSVALIGAVVVAELLKDHLGRPPISHIEWLAVQPTFPSGHATIGMAAALITLVAFGPARPDLIRWIIAAIVVWAAVLTGSGWHRPSDVIAGFLLASASFATVTLLDARPRAHLRGSSERLGDVQPTQTTGRRRLAAAAVAVAVLVFYLPLDPGPAGVRVHWPVYLLAAAATIATGIGVLVAHDRVRR